MKRMKPVKQRPEAKVSKAIQDMLTLKGWYVRKTHGNAFASGWPDLYATHAMYKARWIEVKLPGMKGSKFTSAQLLDFPKFEAFGSGIYVLTAATDAEYNKLFKAPNYAMYLAGLM